MSPDEHATWRTCAAYLRALLTQYGPMPAASLRRAAEECQEMAQRQGDSRCAVIVTLAEAASREESAVLL